MADGLEITSAYYDADSQVLYLRGVCLSESREAAISVSGPDGVLFGAAAAGLRFLDARLPADKYRGWLFEARLAAALGEGSVITVRADTAAEPAEAKWIVGQPPPHKPRGLPAFEPWKQVPVESLPALREPASVIFLCVHNLDVEDRLEKLRCFERIDAELRRFGWRFVVVHHSRFRVSSPLEVVEFNEQPPAQTAPGWALMRPGATEALREATGFLAAFLRAQGSRRTWEDCHAQVWHEATVFEDLFRRYRPGLCVLWHEWNSFARMNRFVSTAYGVPFTYAHEGFLAGTLGLDRLGEMAESLPATFAEPPPTQPVEPADLERADRILEHIRRHRLDRKTQVAPGAVAAALKPWREAGKRIVFCAGSNDSQCGLLPHWWSQAARHSPVYLTSIDFLEAVLEVATQEDFYVLFKPHPNVPFKRGDLRPDRLLVLRGANVLECCQETDVTATLVSAVVYGAAICGRPVVLGGQNAFNRKGYAYEPHDRLGLPDAFRAAFEHRDWEARQVAWRRHAAWLLRYYLFPYNDEFASLMERSHRDTARALLKSVVAGRNEPDEGLAR